MGGLTRVRAGLLRHCGRLVPTGRRAWMEALWAEAGQVPAGQAARWHSASCRRRGLAGGRPAGLVEDSPFTAEPALPRAG